nr:MAG TPA: hypothetical protein [Caudoviricetes sp.]
MRKKRIGYKFNHPESNRHLYKLPLAVPILFIIVYVISAKKRKGLVSLNSIVIYRS